MALTITCKGTMVRGRENAFPEASGCMYCGQWDAGLNKPLAWSCRALRMFLSVNIVFIFRTENWRTVIVGKPCRAPAHTDEIITSVTFSTFPVSLFLPSCGLSEHILQPELEVPPQDRFLLLQAGCWRSKMWKVSLGILGLWRKRLPTLWLCQRLWQAHRRVSQQVSKLLLVNKLHNP